MTGHGGWPMTVFMTPDGRPFFGGTYFPKAAGAPSPTCCGASTTRGAPAARSCSTRPAQLTDVDRPHVAAHAADGALPGTDVLDAALQQLGSPVRSEWGGFGQAPEVPSDDDARPPAPGATPTSATRRDARCHHLARRHGRRAASTTTSAAGSPATRSTSSGWCPTSRRCSTTRRCSPGSYLHAWQVTGEPRYRQVLDETIDLRPARPAPPEGGFYSAEDADSLDPRPQRGGPLLRLDARRDRRGARRPRPTWRSSGTGVTEGGNFEGRNILSPHRSAATSSGRRRSSEARRALFDERERPVRPGSTTRCSPSGTR